jgi:hypothetical protein
MKICLQFATESLNIPPKKPRGRILNPRLGDGKGLSYTDPASLCSLAGWYDNSMPHGKSQLVNSQKCVSEKETICVKRMCMATRGAGGEDS